MNMIHVRCVTNNDQLRKAAWPQIVACVPVVGHRIRSVNSTTTATISDVTHVTEMRGSTVIPILELYLSARMS